MNYIEKMNFRTDIQQLCEFIINGNEILQIDKRSLKERIETSENFFINLLEANCKPEQLEELRRTFYNCLSETQSAYTQIGMQAGARIIEQLLFHPLGNSNL